MNKQLISGGQASYNNLYYWRNMLTSVADDGINMFYKVLNKGYMHQISMMPVQGLIKLSCSYKYITYNCVLTMDIDLLLDDETIINNKVNLQLTSLNTWSVFMLDIDIPTDRKIKQLSLYITYLGDMYGAVSNISALTYYRNITEGITADEFVDKSITYGLDKDIPYLGVDE